MEGRLGGSLGAPGLVVAVGVVFDGPDEVFDLLGGGSVVGEVKGGGCGADVGDGNVMGGLGGAAGLPEDFVAVEFGEIVWEAEVEHGVVEGAFLLFVFGEAPDVEDLLVPGGGARRTGHESFALEGM